MSAPDRKAHAAAFAAAMRASVAARSASEPSAEPSLEPSLDPSVDPDATARARAHRAAVAARLVAQAPQAAAALDWDALGRAPGWLALPEDELMRLRCRLGALLHVGLLRLWIDRPRLQAARQAVGEPWFAALVGARPMPAPPCDGVDRRPIERAEDVAARLAAAGAALLLAACEPGPLQRAVAAAFGDVAPAGSGLEAARALVARALS